MIELQTVREKRRKSFSDKVAASLVASKRWELPKDSELEFSGVKFSKKPKKAKENQEDK